MPMKHLVNSRQSGFSMIEVLVTLVILAVGLLGLAGLQSVGLKNNHSSLGRSAATMFAYNIIDRMRANCQNALDGDYDIAIGTAAPSSPSNQVQRDQKQWKDALSASLVAGDGSISVNAANFLATVNIRWNDSRSTAGTATYTVSVQGVLPALATCQGI